MELNKIAAVFTIVVGIMTGIGIIVKAISTVVKNKEKIKGTLAEWTRRGIKANLRFLLFIITRKLSPSRCTCVVKRKVGYFPILPKKIVAVIFWLKR